MNCYTTHVPRIASAFFYEPLPVFRRVALFTLATIQQQFHTVPTILDEWEQHGADAESCWGMKQDGWYFLNDEEQWHPVAFQLLDAVREEDRIAGIDCLVAIPGINVVKAAFICQMVGLETACLDTQNIKRLGIDNINAFAIRPTNTAKTRNAKIEAYLTLCDKLGGSEYFWNAWCGQIAEIYPNHFDMDLDVSAVHISQTLGRLPADGKVPF